MTETQQINISPATIKQWFSQNKDVIVHSCNFTHNEHSATAEIIFCNGMVDSSMINLVIIPELRKLFEITLFHSEQAVNHASNLLWTAHNSKNIDFSKEWISSFIFEGQLLVFIPDLQCSWMINIANIPKRNPTESATEVSIRGAKDGFVEDLDTNIALLRKRARTTNLACEMFRLGTETKTKTALLYMSDIANADTINEVRQKLNNINTEKLISTGELEELLSPSLFTLFPITDYTGRADFAMHCLMNGRFVIVLDNNPTVIIAPINLFLLMKSPEDIYFPLISVIFGRLLRVVGLLVTIFLPGFYIAITTFHSDQLPFSLLATISLGRHGLPMESAIEMVFIMGLMELFREAGIRMPSSVGQTLTVVGGLIIGDAAIRAGIVSPLMIVISAVTVVSGATLVNQLLTSSTTLLRYTSFLLSATLGMYGYILSLIAFTVYLSSVKSFGVSYLAPVTPLRFSEMFSAIIKLPIKWMKKRPAALDTKKPDKEGEPT